MKLVYGIILFTVAQILAWFQSNSGVLSEPFKSNYILIALLFGPIVSVTFAMATVNLYESLSLWSIRFLGFAIGYMIFIPLTWYFLGEEIMTLKNIISMVLCVTLLLVQFLMR